MSAALPRLANLRDVADGLPAGSIARGVLFRSDAPRTGDETPALLPWPPEVVIDLRHPEEHNSTHPWEGHSTVHVLPLFASAAPTKGVGISPNAEELADIYRKMLTRRPAAKLVQIVALVANASGPALIHCAAGKDRTGVSVALLLRLCGIDRDAVLAEYALTTPARTGIYHRLAHDYGSDVADMPESALLVPREALIAVMDAWDAHEGSTEGWYLANAGDPPTLELLRSRFAAR